MMWTCHRKTNVPELDSLQRGRCEAHPATLQNCILYSLRNSAEVSEIMQADDFPPYIFKASGLYSLCIHANRFLKDHQMRIECNMIKASELVQTKMPP